jgi:hypothetical protein
MHEPAEDFAAQNHRRDPTGQGFEFQGFEFQGFEFQGFEFHLTFPSPLVFGMRPETAPGSAIPKTFYT